MALEDALRRLNEEANYEINLGIGDLLRRRADREDWRQSPILQHLETNAPNLNSWNELFRRTREALADPEELPRKAVALLRPENLLFDLLLDDFLAEMIAAQYLSTLGHRDIHFLLNEEEITTDLRSVDDRFTYLTEAKNLREPNSITYVAFERWHQNQAADPEMFNFTAELLALDDPFEDLTALQTAAIRRLVDGLPRRHRPSTFVHTLPGDRRVRIRIADGRGGMVRHGPGPFLVDEAVDECERSLVMKLLDPTRKALSQLYSAAVPAEYRRLLFVRWKPPDQILAIGEADNVRTAVRDNVQALLRQFFPRFALAILHSGDEWEHVPRVNWE